MKVLLTVLFALIFVVVLANYFANAAEHFTPHRWERSYPKYCSSCADLPRNKCNNCINCGYCVAPRGKGECVPGDENGPMFREDCMYYEYNNPMFMYNNPVVMYNDPVYFFDYLYFYRPKLFAHIPVIYKEYWKTDCPTPTEKLPAPIRPKPPNHDDLA